ncbi:hypothetical protein THAOC_11983, partial [Thalassiosira oceanica]
MFSSIRSASRPLVRRVATSQGKLLRLAARFPEETEAQVSSHWFGPGGWWAGGHLLGTSQPTKTNATPAVRTFAKLSEGENVVVPLITDSLEWTLSSPPPLHQFEEPPLMVECEHLALKPGAEVEEVLEGQGETITDIIGKEGWVANDPALYEGLIPQNVEWTEFIDEKTGEWVYLDE